MKLRLLRFSDTLKDSFWFLPAAMALLAALAAMGSVALDHHIGSAWVRGPGWVWSGSADGARSVLTVVASSVMTVVSIVFSITVTALAQTSSHFGPRVLRNFTSDRGNQFVLGTFIATFVYCFLVLRTVRSVEESRFVPYISVNIGVATALVSLGVLIYFIHHVSQSIQAETLIAGVGEDFQRLVPILFPEKSDVRAMRPGPTSRDSSEWEGRGAARAPRNGYVQRIDLDRLLQIARERDFVVRIEKRPGDFVARDTALVTLASQSFKGESISKEAVRGFEKPIIACFGIGSHRTPYQDAIYPLQQLSEIAVHAMSPGINEPYTALACIDWTGSSLRAVLQRDICPERHYDENDRLRILLRPFTFEELAATAFNQLRLYGAQNPDVAIWLLDTISSLSTCLRRPGERECLLSHVQLIIQDAGRIVNATDRLRVEQRGAAALHALTHDLRSDVT